MDFVTSVAANLATKAASQTIRSFFNEDVPTNYIWRLTSKIHSTHATVHVVSMERAIWNEHLKEWLLALIAAADEGNIALDAKFSASICIADDRIIDMLVKNALTNLECLLSEANVYLQLFELEQQEALKTATVGGDPEIATLTQLIVSGPTSDDIILVEPRYDSRMMRINPMPRLFRKYEIPHYDSLKWKHFCFWHEFDETMKCVEYERRRNKKLKARYYLMSSVRARNS